MRGTARPPAGAAWVLAAGRAAIGLGRIPEAVVVSTVTVFVLPVLRILEDRLPPRAPLHERHDAPRGRKES